MSTTDDTNAALRGSESNDLLGVFHEPTVHGLHSGSGCTHLHELKVWGSFFDALMVGTKTFEVRRDDRGFKVGDYLRIREWVEGEYSGRELTKRVTYMLEGGAFGLEAGHVVLALADA